MVKKETKKLNLEQKKINLAEIDEKAKLLQSQKIISAENQKEIENLLSNHKKEITYLKKLKKERSESNLLIKNTKESIKSIRLSQLKEISSFVNPPQMIKNTLEGIFLLKEEKILDWKIIKKEIKSGKKFINSVLEINLKKINKNVILKLKKNYFKAGNINLEQLRKVSQTMTPFGQFLNEVINVQKREKKIQTLLKRIKEIKKERKELMGTEFVKANF